MPETVDTQAAEQRETADTTSSPKVMYGLSGKLIVLTIVFVMVGEVAIYVPSIANFRETWLHERLAAAQIASLVLEATPDNMVSEELKRELLANAGAHAVALRRGEARHLMLMSQTPFTIDEHFDLRTGTFYGLIYDALETIAVGDGRVIRIVDHAQHKAGDFIEIVIDEAPLRAAMLAYSRNILALSVILSLMVAVAIYIALDRIFVKPMRRLTRNMVRFGENPEDADRIIVPSGRRDEIGRAEEELAHMQRQLSTLLKQKNHLASLGLAVSKISHDLRNMLGSAQLISDRLGSIDDPTVQRLAPKLIASIDRAIEFCAHTLKYGRAQEAPPRRERFALAALLEEVVDTASARAPDSITWHVRVADDLQIDADREHMLRILLNLSHNAVQALETGAGPGSPEVRLSAWREGSVVTVEVRDNGPGVPQRARAHLFQAFQGSVRPGGTGLGLAIAAELARAHGGEIRLIDSDRGATFWVVIPDRVAQLPRHQRQA